MHSSIKKFTYIVYILAFTSCGHFPKEVEEALLSAKDNKENLIAVLEHYKGKDSKKYAAACFLIANMPYHKYTPYLFPLFQKDRLDLSSRFQHQCKRLYTTNISC